MSYVESSVVEVGGVLFYREVGFLVCGWDGVATKGCVILLLELSRNFFLSD